MTALPYGAFSVGDGEVRLGVLTDDGGVVDLRRLSEAGAVPDPAGALRTSSLNAFMAEGPARWSEVRAALPDGQPLSVCLSASDLEPGGTSEDDAVEAACRFADAGADLFTVVAGQTTRGFRPDYAGAYGAPWADLIRNRARVPAVAVGGIPNIWDANGLLAAGRADLCVLGRPRQPPLAQLRQLDLFLCLPGGERRDPRLGHFVCRARLIHLLGRADAVLQHPLRPRERDACVLELGIHSSLL